MSHPKLSVVDLRFNRIGEEGGKLLAPALTAENTQIESFEPDSTVPNELFYLLRRKPKPNKKKKKAKAKK